MQKLVKCPLLIDPRKAVNLPSQVFKVHVSERFTIREGFHIFGKSSVAGKEQRFPSPDLVPGHHRAQQVTKEPFKHEKGQCRALFHISRANGAMRRHLLTSVRKHRHSDHLPLVHTTQSNTKQKKHGRAHYRSEVLTQLPLVIQSVDLVQCGRFSGLLLQSSHVAENQSCVLMTHVLSFLDIALSRTRFHVCSTSALPLLFLFMHSISRQILLV